VIPTFNQKPSYLKAAVHSALAQTVPVEVIVVDDGTTDYALAVTDDTRPVAPSNDKTVWLPSGVKLIRQEQNKGIAHALNAGIKAMSTNWFCWLSSDDLIDPRKVEVQQAALIQANAQAGFHIYQILNADGLPLNGMIRPEWKSLREQQIMLTRQCSINGSTVMIHRAVFDECGLFDPEYQYGQDWEMWNRIGQKFFWYLVDELLGTRRVGDNLTEQIEQEPATGARRLRRDRENALIQATFSRKIAQNFDFPVGASPVEQSVPISP
jgi:glycosyltransferase involved in cell wall biosynthesis